MGAIAGPTVTKVRNVTMKTKVCILPSLISAADIVLLNNARKVGKLVLSSTFYNIVIMSKSVFFIQLRSPAPLTKGTIV
jgi:hypothetical protein